MRESALVAGIVLAALASSGAAQKATPRAAAQDTVQCDLQGPSGASSVKQPDGTYIYYQGGGVTVTCPARHYVLTSDSAENHEAQHRYYFIGHVHYTEPRIKLTSDYLSYWQIGDSVHAVGSVHAVQPTGSTLDGPVVFYYHESPGIRPRDQVMATNGPTMKIAQRDSLGRPDSAVRVTALTLFMDGDSLLYASQQVVISRASMVSHSDSAFLDQRAGANVTHLIGKPVIDGFAQLDSAKTSDATAKKTHGRSFELHGTLIDAYFPNNKVNRILARGSASATSEDLSLEADTIDIRVANDSIRRAIARLRAVATNKNMQLVADTIDLRINNNLLERAIAWNKTKEAKAISPTYTMTADSIDIFMPNQHVRRIDAVRHALATAPPDSTKMKTSERDQIWGDKIIAHFDSIPPRDTTKEAALREIIASADTLLWTKSDSLRAKAYYHIATGDTVDRRPAIQYSRAKRTITIDFARQQVMNVTMLGGVSGIYVTPLDTTNAKTDSTAKKKPPATPADSAAKKKPPPPDSTVVKKPPALLRPQ